MVKWAEPLDGLWQLEQSRDCEFLFQLSNTVKNVLTPQVSSGKMSSRK